MKRLIVCPYISANSHGNENGGRTFSVLNSHLISEPAHVCPCSITQLNVCLGDIVIYPQPVTFSYELYLNEMNGIFGVNSNKTMGLCSSRFSLIDNNNSFGYIIADLSPPIQLRDDNSNFISPNHPAFFPTDTQDISCISCFFYLL